MNDRHNSVQTTDKLKVRKVEKNMRHLGNDYRIKKLLPSKRKKFYIVSCSTWDGIKPR